MNSAPSSSLSTTTAIMAGGFLGFSQSLSDVVTAYPPAVFAEHAADAASVCSGGWDEAAGLRQAPDFTAAQPPDRDSLCCEELVSRIEQQLHLITAKIPPAGDAQAHALLTALTAKIDALTFQHQQQQSLVCHHWPRALQTSPRKDQRQRNPAASLRVELASIRRLAAATHRLLT